MKRFAVLAALLVTAAGLPGLAGSTAVADTPTAGQSVFVPVDPRRVLDTRSGTGGVVGRLGPGGVVDLAAPAGATSVVLNVTATGGTSKTDVRVYPTPSGTEPVPTVSSLNVPAGLTIANQVTVKVGSGGRVRLRNEAGLLHLVADLSGYTTTAVTGASTFVPRAPVRLLDTRPGVPVPAGGQRVLSVRRTSTGAASGVPAGATAVVLNVTAVAPTRSTYVGVFPYRPGTAAPSTSSLNAPAGRTVPNLVTVRVGADDSVVLRNQSGSVDLLADLAGWYVGGTAGAAYHPVVPVRLLDTRPTATPIGPGQTRDLRIAGEGRVGRGDVPAVASAVVLNVTAVSPTTTSDLRVYPAGTAKPNASNLNVVRGQTVPNAVVARIGRDGAVRVSNTSGSVHVVVDLAGWFAPTGDGWDISWPQCTAAGSPTSRLPSGGAFSVVGLTRGRPFSDNECFAAQWQWASSLPGEPSVYLNVDAPGAGDRSTTNEQVWAEVCGTGTPTNACGRAYGTRVAQYALPRLPTGPGGGRPMVWMDVEGPYASGPFWTTDPGVNAAVIAGAIDTLGAQGYRVGIYSDRADSTSPDWRNIVGGYRLEKRQNWVFRLADTEAAGAMCGKEISFSGGPAVMVQIQPNASTSAYDQNHLC